jgi:flavin-binding protein dodecin
MTTLKVVEVLAESSKSWEDAAKEAIDEARKTVRNIRSVYIENMQATVSGDRIDKYRVNAKITFEVENGRARPASRVGRSVDAASPRTV